jgi:hypothetical protein
MLQTYSSTALTVATPVEDLTSREAGHSPLQGQNTPHPATAAIYGAEIVAPPREEPCGCWIEATQTLLLHDVAQAEARNDMLSISSRNE